MHALTSQLLSMRVMCSVWLSLYDYYIVVPVKYYRKEERRQACVYMCTLESLRIHNTYFLETFRSLL